MKPGPKRSPLLSGFSNGRARCDVRNRCRCRQGVPPDFLTPRELKLFWGVMADPATRRIIGRDTMTLGRYVFYLRLWIDAKALLDAGEQPFEVISSKHGSRRARAVRLLRP